jgi:hypothetical protein
MRRRVFVKGIAAFAAWPITARTQQSNYRRAARLSH